MKITVIYGNAHHGSTWHCMDLFRQELTRYEDVQMKEIILPKDMPELCVGCFSCFYKGEQSCPHAERITPIVKAMEEADLIVMTSPVYAMDVSGNLKALLDHLCFMWISHRPNPLMFHKVGLTIVTTAGAGASHTTKTMKNSFDFWGCKKVFVFKKTVAAMKWEDVTEKNKSKIKKQIVKQAKKIHRTVQLISKTHHPIFKQFLFQVMKGMQKNNTWNPYDHNHWEKQSWLSGMKPF